MDIKDIVARTRFTRKPVYLSEVFTETFLSKEEIELLEKIEHSDIINHFIYYDFKKTPPKVFILKKNEEMFLVNTEGFNYCRYVAKIVERG